MHNKKLVWDEISQGMADGGYPRRAQQRCVKFNKLKQKYRKIRDGYKISENQRQEWEMFEPLDRALGWKPISKPTVVADSMVTLPSLFELFYFFYSIFGVAFMCIISKIKRPFRGDRINAKGIVTNLSKSFLAGVWLNRLVSFSDYTLRCCIRFLWLVRFTFYDTSMEPSNGK